MGWGWLIPSMVYGDPWRERRTMFQKHLHSSNTQLFQPIQIEFIRKMLPRLLDVPGEFLSISRQLVDSPLCYRVSFAPLLHSAIGGMIISLSYGIQIKETNDPFVELAETALKSATDAASMGTFHVDLIPILKYVPEFVPGVGFRKQARIGRKLQEDFRERPYLASIEAMVFYLCIFHL
jgi:hypothetical protein